MIQSMTYGDRAESFQLSRRCDDASLNGQTSLSHRSPVDDRAAHHRDVREPNAVFIGKIVVAVQ